MKIFNQIANKYWGPCITYVQKDFEARVPHLYLTFDDGPDPQLTEKVLRLLEQHQVKASFFVIVQKALLHSDLVLEMKNSSHAVGNHSWDHHYKNYFRNKEVLKDWIKKGEEGLNRLLNEKNIGFRSPAGIRTPALHKALNDLDLPLILWNIRFFDTQIQWTKKRALSVIDKLKPGDIILLHDRSVGWPIENFLETLSVFIEKAQEKGFLFQSFGERRS